MYYNDIKGQKWVVNDNLEVVSSDLGTISSLEQEFGLLVVREPFKDGHVVEVNCSHQGYITKLKNCEFFTINKIMVSIHERNKGYVLSVHGYLEEKGLTLRSKKPVFSDEERQRRAEVFRKNLTKNKLGD